MFVGKAADPLVKSATPTQQSTDGEICIRPQKPLNEKSFVRFPILGKVGSSDGLSLLRYRVAPAVVLASNMNDQASAARNASSVQKSRGIKI